MVVISVLSVQSNNADCKTVSNINRAGEAAHATKTRMEALNHTAVCLSSHSANLSQTTPRGNITTRLTFKKLAAVCFFAGFASAITSVMVTSAASASTSSWSFLSASYAMTLLDSDFVWSLRGASWSKSQRIMCYMKNYFWGLVDVFYFIAAEYMRIQKR